MSTWKRAFLYVIRKKMKTVLLFLVLLAMSTFVLAGLSIYKAADDSALSLRQSVGGSIRLELDEDNGANWRYQQAAGGMMVDYVGTPITDKDIQKIMSIDGVKAYNGIGDGSVYAKDFDFISGFNFGAGSDYSRLPSVTNSEYFNFFTRKAFRLVEGRHIKEDDDHVVLISTAIAEKNNLKLGDTITVQCCYDSGEYPDVELKVIGIYEYKEDTDSLLIDLWRTGNMLGKIYRGEMYYADLNPVVGSEQGGYRPVLIIQNNTGNLHSPTVIVAAMSGKISEKPDLPTHHKVRSYAGLKEESLVLLEQIRTLDKKRLQEYIGRLNRTDMEQIDRCLAVSLALYVGGGAGQEP